MKDTKNIIDNNGNLKDTSEFQRIEANRASLEKFTEEQIGWRDNYIKFLK